MDEECITLSSDDEEVSQPPKRDLRKDVQIVHLNESSVILPKITKPAAESNGSGPVKATPVVEDDDDVILLSDDDEKVLPKKEIAVEKKSDIASSSDSEPIATGSSAQAEVKGIILNGVGLNADPADEVGSDDFQSDAATEIRAFVDQLQKSDVTKKELNIVERKCWSKYHKLTSEPPELHTKLAGIIERSTDRLSQTESIGVWKVIEILFECFKVENLKKSENVEDRLVCKATGTLNHEEKRQKKVDLLEKKMNKIAEMIKELDEKEVDFDDDEQDHNSPYLQSQRLRKKYMDCYNLICEIKQCSKLTGRPVHKKLDISHLTTYPEFEKVVQDYVNSKGAEFVPDYPEIRSLVLKENTSAKLNFDSVSIDAISKSLLEAVMKKIKARRAQDFRLVFSQLDESPIVLDPAENNPELLKKLDENREVRRSEDEVLEAFVAKQNEENSQEELVEEENPDASPAPSDNEQAEEDEEDDDAPSDAESSVSALGDVKDAAEKTGSIVVKAEPLFEDEGDEETGKCFEALEDGDIEPSPEDESEEEVPEEEAEMEVCTNGSKEVEADLLIDEPSAKRIKLDKPESEPEKST